ncbi:MAG TPA: PQQ-binding-like beta-propeller repeat protein [Pyrinomonadaceae bacterium]|jgi:outer membrane protein assembly factor BamB|nr:PQQ-binding-like beta-propeller repeat protein [Pyrinomonadaceae bacterium]
MFETQESEAWYRSTRGKILAAILIVMLGAGAVVLFLSWRRGNEKEAHYAALEQHRAQQAASAGEQAAAAPNAPQQTASPTAPAAGAQPASPAETAAAHAARNYWTNFRGPNRDGFYNEMPVSTNWPSQGLPLIWKAPVGLGFASFTIADGRAYTIEQRRQKEVVAAYDVNNGRELWTQGWNAAYNDSTGDGPRTTPTWDDGRLYALGATGELRCLDAKSGAVIWGKNILTDNQASNLQWAMAASPLIVDDKVIVLPGGSGGKAVVAYNKLSGAPVWKSQNDAAAYVSPMLVTLAGRRQILVEMAARVFGLAPEDGSLLWSQSWDTDMGINVSQPIIVDKNRFFLSSGYGKGAALVEITGSGKSFAARTVWENISMKNKFNSSVLHEGFVYGLDEGILTCLDVNTGVRKWKGGRYGYGQVLLASGHLIVMSDTGELALVKASPNEYSEVARFAAIEGKTWNYPAIAGGRLFVRNADQMAAYNIAVN